MASNLQNLKNKLRRAVLLSPSRKKALRKVLSTLSPDQQSRLEKMLDNQSGGLANISTSAITRAIDTNNSAFLLNVEAFFAKSAKKLAKVDEAGEGTQSQVRAENIISNIQ